MVATAPWFPPLRCSTPEPSTRLHAGGYNFLTSHPCISLEPRFNPEVGSTREKLRSSNKGVSRNSDHHTKDGFGQASILPPCHAALLVAGVDFSRPCRMDRSAGVALGLSEHGVVPSCGIASIVGLSGRQLFEYPGGEPARGADRLRAGGLVLRHALCDPRGDQPARDGDRRQRRRRGDPGIALYFAVRRKPLMDQCDYRHRSGGGGVPLAFAVRSLARHSASCFFAP